MNPYNFPFSHLTLKQSSHSQSTFLCAFSILLPKRLDSPGKYPLSGSHHGANPLLTNRNIQAEWLPVPPNLQHWYASAASSYQLSLVEKEHHGLGSATLGSQSNPCTNAPDVRARGLHHRTGSRLR